MKRNKLSKLGLNLKDDVRKDKDFFLRSSILNSSPRCNISDGNQYLSSFRNPLRN